MLWYLYEATSESAPNGYGTHLCASILQNDKIISCAKLGESSFGADSPYWIENLTTFTLTNTDVK